MVGGRSQRRDRIEVGRSHARPSRARPRLPSVIGDRPPRLATGLEARSFDSASDGRDDGGRGFVTRAMGPCQLAAA